MQLICFGPRPSGKPVFRADQVPSPAVLKLVGQYVPSSQHKTGVKPAIKPASLSAFLTGTNSLWIFVQGKRNKNKIIGVYTHKKEAFLMHSAL